MLKGKIKPDHLPANKFKLIVEGVEYTVLSISGLEETLQVVDLPDRTRASGGQTEPIEFTISIPAHHDVEVAAMELWYRQSKDPVAPTYKKLGVLIIESLSGGKRRSYSLIGLFPAGRTIAPDLEMANEGAMVELQWRMQCDHIEPLT